MGSEWRETTVADLMKSGHASLQTGPFGTALKAAEYAAEGVPLVSVREIRHGYFELTEHTPFVNEKTLYRLPKFILRQGDIVFGRKGAVDRSAMVLKNQDGWFLGSDGIRLRLDGSCDHRFISYQVRSPAIQNWLMQHAEGTTMLSMNQKVLGRIPLILPPLPEQKAIAHILGSLDDKIELNRRINATLEGMAQALFKSWFVDFDPVIDNALAAGNSIPEELAERAEVRRKALADGTANRKAAKQFPAAFQLTEEMGWIPEGWEAATLGDYLEIKRGGSPRPIHDFLRPEGLPWVKIADATASMSRFLFVTKDFIKPEGLKKTVLLKKGTLILSNSATPGLPIFLEIDACIHDGWLHFPKKKHFSDLYLYQFFLVIREELVAQGNGSVFTNLKTDILRSERIIAPPSSLLEFFESWMKANFEKILSLNIEIRTLTNLRDTLLPKLISGELRIPEAEKLTEEALA